MDDSISALPGIADLLVGKVVVSIELSKLREHPDNQKYFGEPNAEDDKKLDDDMKARGQATPLYVVGERSARPFGTIMAGHRRFRSLVRTGGTEAKVIVLDDLDDPTIHMILLADGAAAGCTRPSDIARESKLVLHLRFALSRRKGQRSDLGCGEKGETDSLIAKQLNMPVTQVRNLTKVFGSRASTALVKTAVERGKVSISHAADLVRDIEMKRITPAEVNRLLTTSSSAADIEGAKKQRKEKEKNKKKGPLQASGQPSRRHEQLVEPGAASSVGIVEAISRAHEANHLLGVALRQQLMSAVAAIADAFRDADNRVDKHGTLLQRTTPLVEMVKRLTAHALRNTSPPPVLADIEADVRFLDELLAGRAKASTEAAP